jgi:hypothetical protein
MPLIYPLESIPRWQAAELAGLPNAEDESHEYKSARISASDLRKELGLAGSAFWNTGGGMLVVGVDGSGRADGGVEVAVGRQPLRDWVDQCCADVAPRAEYRVGIITDPTLGLGTDRCILVVGFGESHAAPHMAPDHRYYIRAGAHTAPAPHFVVEALLARRGLSQPVLRPMLRHKPGVGYVIQLGIVAASNTPAVDVTIQLPQPPPFLSRAQAPVALSVGVISPQAPFFFDVHVMTIGAAYPGGFPVLLEYRDMAGRPFNATFDINVSAQLGQSLMGERGNDEIVRELHDIQSAIKGLVNTIKSNEQHLRHIASKLR